MVLLTAGYGAGYLIMGFSGWMLVLMLGFLLVGVAKGSTIKMCIRDRRRDCPLSIGMSVEIRPVSLL